MHLSFRAVPADLFLAAGIALAILPLIAAGVGGAVRYSLALALVFLVPGYGIAAALFPADGELDWIQRIGLSAGLSIASVALLGVVLNTTPWGLSLASIAASLALLALGTSFLAGLRRLRVPPEHRLGLSVDLALPRWKDAPRAERLLAIGVAIALVSGVAVVAAGLANPPPADRYTELYLLDANGGLVTYPVSLNTTAQGLVIVGVHNVEGRAINYSILVLLMQLSTAYNTTTGQNETVVANTTFLGSFPMEVASGARGQEPYPFSISFTGTYLLEFRLYLGAPQGSPYRFVDLHIVVS